MSFYFGLNVSRNLTDISNATEALRNLNLDIKDLNLLKGTTDPGNVSRSDFLNLSGLDFDFEKITASLNSETSTYSSLTTNVYDENSTIDNNFIINGQFAATSIKYLYVDYSNGSIKAADISTSRASSWSSFETPVVSTTPIFYGGEITLEGILELSSLQLNKPVESIRFESEVPTHKIRVTIDDQLVDLYAMKSIPLNFRGFFRTATISASINVLNNLRPSWVIKNTGDGIEYVYENRLSSTTSTVSFSDTSARERDIKFYYPVDRVRSLSLPSVNLITLPAVTLPALETLEIANNDIREFPNLSTFNSLITLDISNNNLTRAETASLKTLSLSVTERLPSSIRNLSIGNCFSGISTADFSNFVNLTIFNINAGARINRRVSGTGGTAPNVPLTITDYNIRWNLFTNLPANVMNSTTLQNLSIGNNGISQNNLTLASTALVNFESDGNSHNVVDVAGKQNLLSYVVFTSTINGDRNITDKFTNCNSLATISFRSSPINGNFPQFINCNSLSSVDFQSTQITGSSSTKMITSNTLDSCRNSLSFLRVTSSFITPAQEFDIDCFRLMPALDYLEITSAANGLGGAIPDFSTARNIRFILFYSNQLTGTIPNFSNNNRLFFLHLYNNRLTGAVPDISTPTFEHLLLANNQLSTWNELTGVNITRIHLQSNRITRIPNLSNLTRLQELFVNNQDLGSANQLTYTAGSFAGLTNLRSLNISNNNITQGSVDQILEDLNTNYDLNPRGSVSVNLRGNSAPSQSEEIQNIITKLRSGRWIISVQ